MVQKTKQENAKQTTAQSWNRSELQGTRDLEVPENLQASADTVGPKAPSQKRGLSSSLAHYWLSQSLALKQLLHVRM